VAQLRRRADHHLQVAEIRAWAARYGRIPAGSVVMVRSDRSKDWPDPELANREKFPGVSLAALEFLHRDRHTGCPVSAGFPPFRGGTGGYASFTAICPPSWRHGRRISRADAPLPRIARPLHWSTRAGSRVR
jgi:hypothetical protein